MNDRLKKVIFDKLYLNLNNAEVIELYGKIWVVDREEKYWYLEYEQSGKLVWRNQFFENFFPLFSLSKNEYVPIISEWVEELLNCKVKRTISSPMPKSIKVEELLNSN